MLREQPACTLGEANPRSDAHRTMHASMHMQILQPHPIGALHVCMQALEKDGRGKVLVVDGGGSLRCALLGDNIAEMAYKNGWSVSACACTAKGCSRTRILHGSMP